MKVELRISQELIRKVHADLSRKHSFASERVGFLTCASGALQGGGLTLLSEAYHPVADAHYLNIPTVGAAIGAPAFRAAMQFAYNQPVSVFHVHRHEHKGTPRFSGLDLRELHRFVPDFFKVRAGRAHGAIVLSHDSAHGLCWLPGKESPTPINRFVIVGRPTIAIGA